MKKFYLHTPHTEPIRTTCCGIFDEETNTLAIGVARCSKHDNFSRKRGREISEERALNTPILTLVVTGNPGNLFRWVSRGLRHDIACCPQMVNQRI